MKIILIADKLTMLVQYSLFGVVGSDTSAISCEIIDATMRMDDGERITLNSDDRACIMESLGDWIENKVLEHSNGLRGFDAWYAERKMPTDGEARVSVEEALILARAAYDAGQLSMAEVQK